MDVIKGGVTAAKGFQAIGTAAGIKKRNSKDMALIYSETPCCAAGTFTTNVVKAAPVKWDREIVKKAGDVHAIVCNSGIANACTGTQGYEYCSKMAEVTGEVFQIPKEAVLVTSTGVIGKQLPMDLIEKGIRTMAPMLSDSISAGALAAEAVMTTDTVKKEIAVETVIGGKKVTIGGM